MEPIEYLDRLHSLDLGRESFFRISALFLQPKVITRERKRTADQGTQEIDNLGRRPAP